MHQPYLSLQERLHQLAAPHTASDLQNMHKYAQYGSMHIALVWQQHKSFDHYPSVNSYMFSQLTSYGYLVDGRLWSITNHQPIIHQPPIPYTVTAAINTTTTTYGW